MGKTLDDLADVCRSTGYPVVEHDGWQTNSRGGAGGDQTGGYEADAPNHIIVHHTASQTSVENDVNYCLTGPDNPIGNLYLARDGSIHVMAGRAANTNGSGEDPCGIVSDDNMNAKSIAIEAANNGVGEPWPEPQQDSYIKLVAALGAAYGIADAQVHSHFEWAPGRKIDPAGESRYASGSSMWDMDHFRDDVAAGGGTVPPVDLGPGHGPEPTPPPTGGWVCPPFPGTGDYGCSYDTCRAWQDAMILNGIIADNTANHDGVWGNGMHNACLNMQRSWGWGDADGIGGKHTWPHLRSRKVAPCPTCGG